MSSPEGKSNIHIFDDSEAVAHAAARRFVDLAHESINARGGFSVALAGGSTPKRVYELLAMSAAFHPNITTATIAWRAKLCSRTSCCR
jgi:6-phosphogluconolactonase/glucosamine-6-phosphate isomerase/deaminase